jgi:hypothetical protein
MRSFAIFWCLSSEIAPGEACDCRVGINTDAWNSTREQKKAERPSETGNIGDVPAINKLRAGDEPPDDPLHLKYKRVFPLRRLAHHA